MFQMRVRKSAGGIVPLGQVKTSQCSRLWGFYLKKNLRHISLLLCIHLIYLLSLMIILVALNADNSYSIYLYIYNSRINIALLKEHNIPWYFKYIEHSDKIAMSIVFNNKNDLVLYKLLK